MKIKIQLPNPDELTPEQFFAQMRISLKAVEKTYNEAVKGLTDEEKENFWIQYSPRDDIEDLIFNGDRYNTMSFEKKFRDVFCNGNKPLQEIYLEVSSI